MKKTFIIIFSIIIIFAISFYIGIQISSIENRNMQEIANREQKENVEITNSKDEKISPNATLTLKRYYSNCSHTKEETTTISDELVNMNQQELEEEYKEWQIEKFTKTEVVLIKNEKGICGEHYELKEKDGYIVVYNLDENENESLYMTTKIATEYLPQTDKHALQKGIYLYGKQELNEILQDFE